MDVFLKLLIQLYEYLLRLYPRPVQDEFAEEMLRDFSDLATDAKQQGGFSLVVFCFRELIDFPTNVLRMQIKEGRMLKNTHSERDQVTAVFRSGPLRAAFEAAFALSMALIVMWSIVDWILIFMQDQGWMFLLQIAKSHGWKLNYTNSAWAIIYYAVLLLGALLAGAMLALCLRQTRRIINYWLAGFLGLVAPVILIRILGLSLNINDQTLQNSVIDVAWIILAGSGFGLMFSMIVRDREKIPLLLLTGVLGYYAANRIALWLLVPLFPTYTPGPFTWNDLAYVMGLYGITGILLGGTLGAVSGWSSNKSALA